MCRASQEAVHDIIYLIGPKVTLYGHVVQWCHRNFCPSALVKLWGNGNGVLRAISFLAGCHMCTSKHIDTNSHARVGLVCSVMLLINEASKIVLGIYLIVIGWICRSLCKHCITLEWLYVILFMQSRKYNNIQQLIIESKLKRFFLFTSGRLKLQD